jgi:hypothetical protein
MPAVTGPQLRRPVTVPAAVEERQINGFDGIISRFAAGGPVILLKRNRRDLW